MTRLQCNQKMAVGGQFNIYKLISSFLITNFSEALNREFSLFSIPWDLNAGTMDTLISIINIDGHFAIAPLKVL